MTSLLPVIRGAAAPRVIFCDWHGVLCRKPYWHSIIDNDDHPIRQILSDHLDTLFTGGNPEGREWMCGARSSRMVVTDFVARHSALDVEMLLTLLAEDISDMPVEPGLLSALTQARANTVIVLATDNIDVFASAARAHVLGSAGRLAAASTLASAATVFDDVLSSSDLGVLKSQDPQRFFGPWLARNGLDFSDALLIDDRADNCAAFRAQAGAALLWPPHPPAER
ncbi:hypothetical protein IU501_32940 [Nocardia otitidiscaviarum]|uniref:hypothetical protein n=1 Tax=Nocardia otitidiscaviarum TaxID=1823 RepID=UPI0004A6ECCA|nr:hypothetical protein [Nocardia otitidiscaviarum]MBF6137779.1 hypothetical protein [Nocardia otitidiscaviarum]MBF6485300.1 hypothetical protein [Nocardia otitidiscaviarum]